jgi:hypothetical protein
MSRLFLGWKYYVKHDPRHKERLVADGNWTINNKDNIHSGDVDMETMRIRFFLIDFYGISWCACDIRCAHLYRKIKEKFYITADPSLVMIYVVKP